MHDTHHPVHDTDEPREAQESADPRRWKALAVVALAQFMLILDLTVVNVALPDLGADLGLSRTAFTWTVSAYGLAFGGLLLLGGRLADIFGTRPIMLTGLVIFTLASLATGLAQNETVLLGGRVGQGVGAALLSPAALATITSIFHGVERNKALSIWASLGGVGFTAGVLIGGILTAGPGWRWVFFINVPVGPSAGGMNQRQGGHGAGHFHRGGEQADRDGGGSAAASQILDPAAHGGQQRGAAQRPVDADRGVQQCQRGRGVPGPAVSSPADQYGSRPPAASRSPPPCGGPALGGCPDRGAVPPTCGQMHGQAGRSGVAAASRS